ncbi:hypothetical protein J437_LFUL014774 [Ladona fulva]|uniref:Uncharacterized protein n=1 Tax=Ladona fulva TaxID=123851 RepID=A0A8K0P7X5_LADFU|nr:hypothetical protein J437_LFUL014774 [Ladona fulva]
MFVHPLETTAPTPAHSTSSTSATNVEEMLQYSVIDTERVVTPEELRLFPKAIARKSRGSKRLGKTKILTDTPTPNAARPLEDGDTLVMRKVWVHIYNSGKRAEQLSE